MRDFNQNTREQTSVAGGWLGTYRYGGLEALRGPVRFEATLKSRSEGLIEGEIIDDCALGYASVTGGQDGSSIWFSKSYQRGSRFEITGRTHYRGTLADDGKSIRGEWSLEVHAQGLLLVRAFGKWQARRMWSEAEESNPLEESEQLIAANGRTRFF